MPLLSTIATEGGAATYAALQTEVSHNYLVANYGGAQGFDNVSFPNATPARAPRAPEKAAPHARALTSSRKTPMQWDPATTGRRLLLLHPYQQLCARGGV